MTPKQERFCNEYIKTLNATQSYKTAYSCKNDHTARVNASNLLANTSIQEYIAKRQEKLQQETNITQQKIINELAAIAFADATDYAKLVVKKERLPIRNEKDEIIDYEEVEYTDIKFTPTAFLSEKQRKAVACIKRSKYGTEVCLSDKEKALELLGKHLGMFKESVRLEQDKPFEVNITVRKNQH